jgi:hypothetical protein
MYRFFLSLAVAGLTLLAFPRPVSAEESRLGIVLIATKEGQTQVGVVTRGTVGEFMDFHEGDTITSYTYNKKSVVVKKPADMPELLRGEPGQYTIDLKRKDSTPYRINGEVKEKKVEGRSILVFIRK